MRLPLDILQTCRFLAGPTACGKSETAVALALRIDAEIVSMDSMSLYRGMDIGTAKPSRALRECVSHHLVDILDPAEDFSVAQYIAAAETSCRQILARGRIPLFVGGTGLYLRSLLRGVCQSPAANLELRRSLQAEGEHTLHDRLRAVDPVAAGRIHASDSRRLIRALEVHASTGLRLSELQGQNPLPADIRPRHVFWLCPPRRWLYERINERVERMFQEGLVGEVRRLLSESEPLGRTARQALGYRQVIDHLEDRQSLADTVRLVQTKTRQFAKRQHTWFRNLVECRAVEMSGEETPSELAERILAADHP